ncbi:hypothetical protein C8R46DRAFT_599650 [Mycena filopes]|nr:hypothetical protein C8R46DRAFT_599650 [Mycena filopes]
MSSLFTQLFCCCLRPRPAPPDVESTTVIPNEHSRLLEPPASPASVVDHQSLSDRLGTIVRAKEGKMVSVSARTPFTLVHDAEPQLPSSSSTTTSANRRPPILTMTPARSHGSLNLHSDSQSQSRSRSRSRPSSRSDSLASSPRRAAHSPLPPVAPPAPPPASASGSAERNAPAPVDASEWFVESESELVSGEEDHDHEDSDDILPHATPRPTPAADPQSIAFDWDA